MDTDDGAQPQRGNIETLGYVPPFRGYRVAHELERGSWEANATMFRLPPSRRLRRRHEVC